MAPLDTTSCWARRAVSSGGACHLQVAGGGTRLDQPHQPSVEQHQRWRVPIPFIHWFVQVGRGRKEESRKYWLNFCNVNRDQRWNLAFSAEVFSEGNVEMSGTSSAKSHWYCELSLLGAKLWWWLGFWSPSSKLVGNCQHWLWLFEHYTTSKLQTTWHHLTTAQSFVCIYRQMTYQPLCSSGNAPLED